MEIAKKGRGNRSGSLSLSLRSLILNFRAGASQITFRISLKRNPPPLLLIISPARDRSHCITPRISFQLSNPRSRHTLSRRTNGTAPQSQSLRWRISPRWSRCLDFLAQMNLVWSPLNIQAYEGDDCC